MGAYPGELAALAASFLFAITSTCFTLAGRRVGSVVVNRTRLLFAVALLMLLHLLLGLPLPFQAPLDRWFWLGLSGLTGLALGDAFLFQAFVVIGPRLSMLLMALAPAIAALLAWIFLGEALSPAKLLGVALALSGVAWVVLEKNGQVAREQEPAGKRGYLVGILFGLAGATGQALGLVTAKPGLHGGFPGISATLIRMLVAAVILWVYTILRRQVRPTFDRLVQQPRAVMLVLAGAIAGPTVAVSLNMFAIQNTAIGVASTLNSLTPIILLPVGYFLFQERFGRQAILGTLLAISGVALLFLV